MCFYGVDNSLFHTQSYMISTDVNMKMDYLQQHVILSIIEQLMDYTECIFYTVTALTNLYQFLVMGPLLLTWFNLNSSMNKQTHAC